MIVTPPEDFVPTPDELIDAKLDLAKVQSGEVIFDLGCGDGRVLFRAAQRFAVSAVGVEFRRPLVEVAQKRARELHLADRVQFVCGDYLEVDCSAADIVVLYLNRGSLGQLSLRLEQNLKAGARIVTHEFDLPGWTAIAESSIDLSNGSSGQLFLYEAA